MKLLEPIKAGEIMSHDYGPSCGHSDIRTYRAIDGDHIELTIPSKYQLSTKQKHFVDKDYIGDIVEIEPQWYVVRGFLFEGTKPWRHDTYQIMSNHFTSLVKAKHYYKDYSNLDDVHAYVELLIKEGSIAIGKPPLQKGATATPDKDGRYIITYAKEETKKKEEAPKPSPHEGLIPSLKTMIPDGNKLKLPAGTMHDYKAVKVLLTKARGVYKTGGYFLFPTDAAEIQQRLVGGEVMNDKKKFQFFGTPPDVVNKILQLAQLEVRDRILEPSAGQGALIDTLATDLFEEITLIELMPENVEILRKKGYDVLQKDFLDHYADHDIPEDQMYDKIIANPPFTNGQDIDHVMHMWSLLKPGGRIVSVIAASWKWGNKKKQKAFRELITANQDGIHELSNGEFKSSGTTIDTTIVVLNKPL